jgi:hypothetical protein
MSASAGPGRFSSQTRTRRRGALTALAVGSVLALIPITPVLAGPSAKVSGSVSTLDETTCQISVTGSGLLPNTEYLVDWEASDLEFNTTVHYELTEATTNSRGRLQASGTSALEITSRDMAQFVARIILDSNEIVRDSIKNNCKAPPTALEDRGYFCLATKKFYTFSSSPMEWSDARDAAPRRGYLAEINSAAENDCVVAARDAAFPEAEEWIWIGAVATGDYGTRTWQWDDSGIVFWNGEYDGAPAFTGAFDNWYRTGEDPNQARTEPNGDGDCVHIWFSGSWNDLPCVSPRFAVYESR